MVREVDARKSAGAEVVRALCCDGTLAVNLDVSPLDATVEHVR